MKTNCYILCLSNLMTSEFNKFCSFRRTKERVYFQHLCQNCFIFEQNFKSSDEKNVELKLGKILILSDENEK